MLFLKNLCKQKFYKRVCGRYRLYSTERIHTEIKIPIEFGHIAAKWWGPQNIQPIVCLHGWQVRLTNLNTA